MIEMGSIRVQVQGSRETIAYFDKLKNRLKNIPNQEFAQMMKVQAQMFLDETSKGWPQYGNTPIHFLTRTKRLAAGNEIIMWATAQGRDGFNYANVQEEGYPNQRFSAGYKTLLKTGKMGAFSPMKFKGKNGEWISKYQVGPIPAKKYMERTAAWAAEAYPVYIEEKVREAIRR